MADDLSRADSLNFGASIFTCLPFYPTRAERTFPTRISGKKNF